MDDFSCQFELCARSFRNNVSVLYCDNTCIIRKLLYKDLLVVSENISTVLQNHVRNNTCIGITTKPNPYLAAMILSIHKQKCAFLCIDINTTELNILRLISRVKLKWILNYDSTDFINSFLSNNASLVCNTSLFDNNIGVEIWKMDNSLEEKLYKDVSYIIQTSGTTGDNKIVQVYHNCIMSNVESLRKIFKMSDKDIIYLGTPLTFDPFVIELMLALTSGACLLIVPEHIKLINKLLLQTLIPENKELHLGVTFMQMPPSVFLCFSENDICNVLCKESNLRILALGGEKFPEQILRYKKCKKLQIFNLYGITEVSCWASVEDVTDLPVSIGETLADTIFEIRNVDGNIARNGEGELFIGSSKRICVINDEPITQCDITIFRETGDMVKTDSVLKKIYYLGRRNSIIKRFGQRVSLSEIEKLVYDTTDLNSICIWDEQKLKLILFVILSKYDEAVKDKVVDRLRIKLLHALPAKANPDVIDLIPSIPLTNNGKVDRNYLMHVININNKININRNPADIFDNLLSKYFGMSAFNTEVRKMCSFLEIGGNSILAIQLISEFDSTVLNSYSADLMALLLDRSKCYLDYYSLIQEHSKMPDAQRNFGSEAGPSKCLKLLDNIDNTVINSDVQLIIAWKYELGACVDATPVHIEHPRFGDLIAVGSHAHIFVILNANSGVVICKTVLSSAIEGSACISPCKEYAIVGCYDGYVYCLNIEHGTILWKFKTASSIKCTPVLSSNNENVIVASYDKTIYCLKIKDGSLVWQQIINESIKSNPVLCGTKCYIATIQGTHLCINEIDGDIIWKHKTNSAVFGSPSVISKEHIIWPDVKGRVQCFNCNNGDKLWTYESSGFIYSSLCQLENRILFGCFDHNVYCLECSAANCKELFKLNVGGQISGTPCVLRLENKRYVIAVNNIGKLHMCDMQTALVVGTIDLCGEVFASPIVVRNKVYVGCRDNHLYCIEIKI